MLTRLSSASRPAVDAVLREDPELADELATALSRAADLCTAALDPNSDDPVYTEDDHAYFTEMARRVADRSEDGELSELVAAAIGAAEPFLGLPSRGIHEHLGPLPELPESPETETDVDMPVPSQVLEYAPENPLRWTNPWITQDLISLEWDRSPVVEVVIGLHEAQNAIEEKARSLGDLAADAEGRVTAVDGGYRQRFADCDIYYSPETGAHEVHGDIRAKYNAVNGPTRLGLPVTDESVCPDGIGRYNHFARSASIYWTPSTGPFYVRGAVRFRWASTGWETGPMGYPVRDEQSLPGLYPQDNPDMSWSVFQNGIVFGQGRDAQPAPAAVATEQQVRTALFRAMDSRLPTRSVMFGGITVTARPGLYGVDLLGVDDWTYGFWAGVPRTLRVRIRGFVSISAPVADPKFHIDLALRFATTWPMDSFTYPSHKTVIATLVSSRIHVSGVFSETIADAVADAIRESFQPGPNNPEVTGPAMVMETVPTGANQKGKGNIDFLDIMLAADGSLQVLVNPLPAGFGRLRQKLAQRALDNALENL